MIVGIFSHGRRNSQFLGFHTYLLSIGRAAALANAGNPHPSKKKAGPFLIPPRLTKEYLLQRALRALPFT